jgi:hypothetical protein
MFHTPINSLKVACWAQSEIGLDNFLKGRVSSDWIMCMDHHFQANGSKLTGHECITKLIMRIWDHIDCIWKYRNKKYHENTNQKVVRYKTVALYRRYEEIWGIYAGLVERLNAFKTNYVEDRQRIGDLNYKSKCRWMNLSEKYIIEAASPVSSPVLT